MNDDNSSAMLSLFAPRLRPGRGHQVGESSGYPVDIYVDPGQNTTPSVILSSYSFQVKQLMKTLGSRKSSSIIS